MAREITYADVAEIKALMLWPGQQQRQAEYLGYKLRGMARNLRALQQLDRAERDGMTVGDVLAHHLWREKFPSSFPAKWGASIDTLMSGWQTRNGMPTQVNTPNAIWSPTRHWFNRTWRRLRGVAHYWAAEQGVSLFALSDRVDRPTVCTQMSLFLALANAIGDYVSDRPLPGGKVLVPKDKLHRVEMDAFCVTDLHRSEGLRIFEAMQRAIEV